MPNFPMCQKCQERNKKSNICILGTRSREMMKEFIDFRNDYNGNHHFCQVFEGFQCEFVMWFIMTRKYL
jgi:hypothetical protein